MDLFETILYFLSVVLLVITLPISLLFCYKIVDQYETVVVLRLGKARRNYPKGAGLVFFLPCIDILYIIDMRVVTLVVPPQEVITKDQVSIKVDAVVFFKVFDPLRSVINVVNYEHATYLLAMTILRNVLGLKTLSEILQKRDVLSSIMRNQLDEATGRWGIVVERIEMTDLRLPLAMQRSMAAEAESSQEAKAKVIDAQAELNASKALGQAADMITSSPGALQLRYLQTLKTISADRHCTIIFPLPVDSMTGTKLKI